MIRSDHIKNKNKNWSLLTFLLDQKQKMIKKKCFDDKGFN